MACGCGGGTASERFNAVAKSCCSSQVSHCPSSCSRLAAEGDSSVVSSGDKGGLSRVLFLSGVAALRRFRLSRLPATLGPSPLLFLKQLKRQCHEIFDFRLSTWITLPQTPDYTIKAVSNFFENSRRFRGDIRSLRWQMEISSIRKILGSRVSM